MAEGTLEVDWEWYNTIVILLGFVPLLGLMLLGPPPYVEPTESGLNDAFLWGVVVGIIGSLIWLLVMARFIKDGTLEELLE